MGPHGEREKISDPGGVWTHDLRNRSPLLLPTELQGQMGAGREKLLKIVIHLASVCFCVPTCSYKNFFLRLRGH